MMEISRIFRKHITPSLYFPSLLRVNPVSPQTKIPRQVKLEVGTFDLLVLHLFDIVAPLFFEKM